nr:MAG TPA: hypothetical protein [Caudoviricetes sp.]
MSSIGTSCKMQEFYHLTYAQITMYYCRIHLYRRPV